MAPSRYSKRFWMVFSLALVLILGGAVAGVAFLVRYTATSGRVCAQCHPQQTEKWKTSKGHPAAITACYACHSKGLEVIPKEWNIFRHARDQLAPPEYLADDTLTTQRCLDCHKDVLMLGYAVKKKIVKFNHRFHYGEGLQCVDCHRTSGHEFMSDGTNRPTVSECLECHRKEFEGPPKNQKCLNCHDVMLVPGTDW